jgi:hypothetical protein
MAFMTLTALPGPEGRTVPGGVKCPGGQQWLGRVQQWRHTHQAGLSVRNGVCYMTKASRPDNVMEFLSLGRVGLEAGRLPW